MAIIVGIINKFFLIGIKQEETNLFQFTKDWDKIRETNLFQFTKDWDKIRRNNLFKFTKDWSKIILQ
jgi:hypothetical protein